MEKEKFLECRNEILKSLETHGMDWKNAAIVCASAINEYGSYPCYVASIMLTPILQEVERQQESINVRVENRRNDATCRSDSFLTGLKGFLERELKASSNL